MAFKLNNFSIGRGVYNNRCTLTSPASHLYASPDGAANVIPVSGYFNNVADSLAVGDMIIIKFPNTSLPSIVYVTEVTPNVTVNSWSPL